VSKPAWAIGARSGPVRDFMQMKAFAIEGLVAIIDERPTKNEGEYVVVTPSDLEERVRALQRTYRGETPAQLTTWQRQEHYQRLQGSNNLMECIKEARDMGDPSDPAVQAYWARHRRNSTIRITGISAGSDRAGYPDLPNLPRGKKTGRTAQIDAEAVVPPNVHSRDFPSVHRPPRKKNRSGLITLE